MKIRQNIGLPDPELQQFKNVLLRILVSLKFKKKSQNPVKYILLRNFVLLELFLTLVFESVEEMGICTDRVPTYTRRTDQTLATEILQKKQDKSNGF